MTCDILQNAISSIEVGVEDLAKSNEDPRRTISAVRNFYSGVLLLMKERLQRQSPELIFAKLRPQAGENGEVSWVGDGNKTADVSAIQKRWKALGWEFDWAPLKSLQKIRNDVEHRSPNGPEKLLRRAVSDTYELATSLLRDHLRESPTKVLSEECWKIMVEENEQYQRLRKSCLQNREKLGGSLPTGVRAMVVDEPSCPVCSADVLVLSSSPPHEYPDVELTCVSCNHETSAMELVGEAAGEDLTEERCPECGQFLYSREHDECLRCEYTRHYYECLCEDELGLEEQDFGGLCGYHHHALTKPD